MLRQSLILTSYLLFATANLTATTVSATESQLVTTSNEINVDSSSELPDLTELVKRAELININNASQRELTSLAGIGKLKAARIIAWREQNGNFQSIEQLAQVSGIGKKTIANIAEYITVQ